jgi:hypothetical protein
MRHLSNPGRAIAARLLRDARLAGVSEATRVAAAVEAGFRYLQQAAAPKNQALGPCIPSKAALTRAFDSLQSSHSDRRLGVQLMEWFERRYELPRPPCTINEAVMWAQRMSTAALQQRRRPVEMLPMQSLLTGSTQRP